LVRDKTPGCKTQGVLSLALWLALLAAAQQHCSSPSSVSLDLFLQLKHKTSRYFLHSLFNSIDSLDLKNISVKHNTTCGFISQEYVEHEVKINTTTTF
jgi:hypothetical protein